MAKQISTKLSQKSTHSDVSTDLTYLLLRSKRTNDLETIPASDLGAKCQ